jgi:hypothetical protein
MESLADEHEVMLEAAGAERQARRVTVVPPRETTEKAPEIFLGFSTVFVVTNARGRTASAGSGVLAGSHSLAIEKKTDCVLRLVEAAS